MNITISILLTKDDVSISIDNMIKCQSEYRVVPKLRTPLKGVLDFGLQRSTGGAGGRAKLVGGADLTTQLLASMLQLSTPEGVLNFGTYRYRVVQNLRISNGDA